MKFPSAILFFLVLWSCCCWWLASGSELISSLSSQQQQRAIFLPKRTSQQPYYRRNYNNNNINNNIIISHSYETATKSRPPSNAMSIISLCEIRGGGGAPSKNKSASKATNNKASITTSIFNLANNVAGAGILTLAAGKAMSGTGWIPSCLISVTLAMASAYTFVLIGQACELTGESTFKGLWGKAFSPKTAWMVDSMVFVQCFFVSIIYTGLLGDIFSALLRDTPLPPQFTSRTFIILAAASCILWPLNRIRDLSSLGFTSILGLVAVLYTVFFIVVRALDGAYTLKADAIGKFVAELPAHLQPSFAKSSLWNFDINSLVLVSNLGLAFIAHYNGPSYWNSLADATTSRFRTVAMSAYAILALIYTVTMSAGYATFGDHCQGNILLNYAATDVLSTLGRLATGCSIIFGFPLISNGAREGLKNAAAALGYPSLQNPDYHVRLVTCLLILTTSLALVLSDIKLIAGLTGAVMGSSLVYICPPLIYAKIVKQTKGIDSPEYRAAQRSLFFIPFGVFTALMGVAMTLKNTVLAK